ncbi:MAG TPA: DUF4344 domain-containing metallopeptidase, partial [Lysobacter sp.]|nr:DUF4344 domain-containing metallopeptidase [Lysobacter sp.]
MTQRLIIIVLSLALGLVSGAFGYSLLSQKRNAKAIAAARAEGRADAEKAMADELAALKPVVLKKVANPEGKADGVHFAYEYVEPKSPELQLFYKLAHDGDLLHQLPEIQAIDGLLMLPRPVTFVMAECREPNAFYSPERAEVVMCYETMKVLLDRGKQLAKDNELGDDYAQKYLGANLRFILLHETGHALIDLLEIPITGREEDAVDQLATTLMQRFAGLNESSRQTADNLRMASNWFLMRSTGQYNLDAYADEHALGEQRYFNLQCLIYGSNPARYVGIVTEG